MSNYTPKLTLNREEVACLEGLVEQAIEMIECEGEDIDNELREELADYQAVHYQMLKFFRVDRAHQYQTAK